jgi:CRISPR-associated endonuclease/helicase Cas3
LSSSDHKNAVLNSPLSINPLFDFWAKSDPTGVELRAHSVPHHCLDVAATAAALLSIYPPPVQLPASTICTLIALHDIGKFSRTFQTKVPELWPPRLGSFEPPPAGYPHDQVGYMLLSGPLSGLLDPLFGNWSTSAARQPLLRAIAGHHGRPPAVQFGDALPDSVACPTCLKAASEFVLAALALFRPAALPRMSARDRQALAWWFAGFAVVADWIGSARQWFPTVPAADNTDLAAYWVRARAQAERAVREAGLTPATVATNGGMGSLFPAISDPRPLQRWAESVTVPTAPCLVVIEDATGAGKTEAALVLAHRQMAAGHASGLAFALPTMATANGMYGRLADIYARLFVRSARPSLVLAHGRSRLNERFTDSILDGAAAEAVDLAQDDPDQPVNAQCAAWIADNRRKGFLAQISVGTIDQALLAVLPTRHAPLRLLGLSQRVLIVDEAHAYDSYMGVELARLLQFHAGMGGSAIVLSATLTAKQRVDLCRAFRTGLGCDGDDNDADADAAAAVTHYPAATIVSAEGIQFHPLELAIDLSRSVAVSRVATVDVAADAIGAAAASDAATCWIRNTVDDAIEAVELLRARGLAPLLFHARFAMGDRLAVEQEVLRLFGPKSTPAERAGRVLVATQVVEQSLDLDFDLLLSDLAPADLIIQRAGRLWRHPWRTARPILGPKLLLLSPEPVADPSPDWLGTARTRFVYDNPAILWRSARALLSTEHITTPGNIRDLVEAAYDEANTPPGLASATLRATGKDGAARGIAGQNVLTFDQPYDRRTGLWEPDEHTPTRLGEPQITLRLAIFANGQVKPLCDDPDAYRAWCLSEISVRASRVAGVADDPETARAVTTLRAHWSNWDRKIPVLVLRAMNAATWQGLVVDAAGVQRVVTYSRTVGLVFAKD